MSNADDTADMRRANLQGSPNRYSEIWFNVFMPTLSSEQTAREVAFLTRQLPAPTYRRILDLCCGFGRHTIALTQQGYAMTGLDRDRGAIAVAQEQAQTLGHDEKPTFVVEDMRRIGELSGTFDAIINMWQSLSYFDEATNTDLLRQMHGKLSANGRLVLDMYHRGFFEAHQGTHEWQIRGVTFTRDRHQQNVTVTTTQTQAIVGNRLRIHLTYSSRADSSDSSDSSNDREGSDTFEWQLYTPDEFIALADGCGFDCLLACANFDEATLPDATLPRMQLVFERNVHRDTTSADDTRTALAPSRAAEDFIARATGNPVFQSLMKRLSTE